MTLLRLFDDNILSPRSFKNKTKIKSANRVLYKTANLLRSPLRFSFSKWKIIALQTVTSVAVVEKTQLEKSELLTKSWLGDDNECPARANFVTTQKPAREMRQRFKQRQTMWPIALIFYVKGEFVFAHFVFQSQFRSSLFLRSSAVM